MEAPDFWDDAEVSQKKMKELKDMKDDMETYQMSFRRILTISVSRHFFPENMTVRMQSLS